MSQVATISKTALQIKDSDVLVGDAGNFSVITGNIYPSSTMRGFFAVETEHGVLYLDDDAEIEYLVTEDLLSGKGWKVETVSKNASQLENGDVLVGDSGNLSVITGDVEPSATLNGFYVVETEHGTLYLDDDEDTEYLVVAE